MRSSRLADLKMYDFNIARLAMGERVHIAAKFENTIRDAGSTSHKLLTLLILPMLLTLLTLLKLFTLPTLHTLLTLLTLLILLSLFKSLTLFTLLHC